MLHIKLSANAKTEGWQSVYSRTEDWQSRSLPSSSKPEEFLKVVSSCTQQPMSQLHEHSKNKSVFLFLHSLSLHYCNNQNQILLLWISIQLPDVYNFDLWLLARRALSACAVLFARGMIFLTHTFNFKNKKHPRKAGLQGTIIVHYICAKCKGFREKQCFLEKHHLNKALRCVCLAAKNNSKKRTFLTHNAAVDVNYKVTYYIGSRKKFTLNIVEILTQAFLNIHKWLLVESVDKLCSYTFTNRCT